jgi:DNA-binding NtrC family response regulator
MPEGRILVVDDEEIVQDVLLALLQKRGYEAASVRTGEEGLEKLAREPFDVVLLDLMLPGISGMETLRRIREEQPEQTVVMMTAFGSVETAVEAMKIGAFHYLTKPFKNDEVLLLIAKAIERRRLVDENRRLKLALSQRYRYGRLIGKSHLMQRIFAMVEQIAPSRSTVLVQGESGTGKELIAHAVHTRSPRAQEPFIVVNSNSIPPDLLESNLFGHTKGAFTGATHDKKGLFEAASGGSIFFDEISTVRPEIQAKLLRVMQEKQFIPLGSTQTVTVDVRIIAATNVDLREMVDRNEFREDLYYRLNVISVKLPPLRERPEDIPLLVADFLEKFNEENHKAVEGFTPAAMERMLRPPVAGERPRAREPGRARGGPLHGTLDRRVPAAGRDQPGGLCGLSVRIASRDRGGVQLLRRHRPLRAGAHRGHPGQVPGRPEARGGDAGPESDHPQRKDQAARDRGQVVALGPCPAIHPVIPRPRLFADGGVWGRVSAFGRHVQP